MIYNGPEAWLLYEKTGLSNVVFPVVFSRRSDQVGRGGGDEARQGPGVRGGIGEWGQHLHTYMRTVMGTAVVLFKPWCVVVIFWASRARWSTVSTGCPQPFPVLCGLSEWGPLVCHSPTHYSGTILKGVVRCGLVWSCVV